MNLILKGSSRNRFFEDRLTNIKFNLNSNLNRCWRANCEKPMYSLTLIKVQTMPSFC